MGREQIPHAELRTKSLPTHIASIAKLWPQLRQAVSTASSTSPSLRRVRVALALAVACMELLHDAASAALDIVAHCRSWTARAVALADFSLGLATAAVQADDERAAADARQADLLAQLHINCASPAIKSVALDVCRVGLTCSILCGGACGAAGGGRAVCLHDVELLSVINCDVQSLPCGLFGLNILKLDTSCRDLQRRTARGGPTADASRQTRRAAGRSRNTEVTKLGMRTRGHT